MSDSEATPPRPNASPSGSKPILTLADLAERWGCSKDTVLKRVEDPARPIPSFALGKPQGQKKRWEMLRFRLEAIQRWERDQEQVKFAPEIAEPPGRPPGYDGPILIGKRRRRIV